MMEGETEASRMTHIFNFQPRFETIVERQTGEWEEGGKRSGFDCLPPATNQSARNTQD